MSIEDLESQVDSLESQIADLVTRVDDLEGNVESIDYEISDVHTEFVLFRSKSANEIQRVKKILALATSPDPEDLEKFKTLREAFDKYEFTRNLILGDNEENVEQD